jgi:SAM-dependent methyltransferase
MKTRECLSDLIGWMENQNAEFDSFADNYDEMLADPLRRRFANSTEFFHRRKLEVLRCSLSAAGRSPSNLDWLDLGCGRGDLLRMGMAEFASASGCDVSPAALKCCTGMSVRQQKHAYTIPFDAQSFDLVTAACVYHHVPVSERLRLTQSVCKVLRPAGMFAIFEHNPWNPVTRAIVRRCPIDVNAILMRSSETAALLTESGFIRISLRYFLFLPEATGAKIASLENWLRWVPVGGQYAVVGELTAANNAAVQAMGESPLRST